MNLNKNENENEKPSAEAMNRYRSYAVVCLTAAVVGILSLWCWLGEERPFSESERRALQRFPALTLKSVTRGSFMTDFEVYTQDQFPLRDSFRSVVSAVNLYVLQRRESNGLYIAQGSVSKLDYPMNKAAIRHACDRFRYLYEQCISGSDAKVYLSIVPDKNHFLAERNGYLAIDYGQFAEYVRGQTKYMSYVDITDTLGADSYYRTDPHWRQERLLPVAERLAAAMGADISAEYTEMTVDAPFYGAYCGQLALPLPPDELRYLTGELPEGCTVTFYDSGQPVVGSMYDMKKAQGRDPYEMFLGGAAALVTIENPSARSGKELVLFRDSFGSSIAPLLAAGYSRITLVDLRYIRSEQVGSLVRFGGQDVLFLYSTLLLGSGLALG